MMAKYMKDNFKIMILMELGNYNKKMDQYIKVY